MHIQVTVTSDELADMKMTAQQLQDSICQCLDENGLNADSNPIDYSGFNVEVVVSNQRGELLMPGGVRALG